MAEHSLSGKADFSQVPCLKAQKQLLSVNTYFAFANVDINVFPKLIHRYC